MAFDLQQCVTMNNQAIEQFEHASFHRSLDILKQVLHSMTELMPRSQQQQGQHERKESQASFPHPNMLRRWSRRGFLQASGKDAVFVHCRAVFLILPNSLDANFYNVYATLILYNIALCYHALSLQETSECGDGGPRYGYSNKAYSLYNMAFATMKESTYKDSVLITVLLNNSGHVLYSQGRAFEATKCLRRVHSLMFNLPMNSLEPDDFHGMYLNSLMVSNTASAA
ncbi:hypothetical protein MHU86_9225 [Fragilaria crotonensis]|nr:hypothetical protein MHU86_9225 [Fragilaria crotonensis]